MKKGAKKEEPPPPEPEEKIEIPQAGFGRFEYINGTMYVGNWKLIGGKKMKHGHGKLTFAGTSASEFGNEEYEGDWEDDLMHGYGVYKYTSGSVYSGSWSKGKMKGKGVMQLADGSKYEGEWLDNLMHGLGEYDDPDGVHWEGIFVNGTFESKIQKKLHAEKVLQDKIKVYEEQVKEFFLKFQEKFAASDKKTFKENLTPFFATPETAAEFIANETFSKYEEKAPDKWNEQLKQIFNEGNCKRTALASREQSTLLQVDNILAEQLREKAGGQIIEVRNQKEDKVLYAVILQLASENFALVVAGEKPLEA